MLCDELRKLKDIKINVANNNCNCGNTQQADNLSLESIVSGEFCPFLLYQSFPYYETFHSGGNFPWMKDLDTVRVQCPNIKSGIEIEIRRCRNGNNIEVYGTVIHKTGECSWGLKQGMKVNLDSNIMKKGCYKAYNLLFPHIFSLASLNTTGLCLRLQCPKSNRTVFEITK